MWIVILRSLKDVGGQALRLAGLLLFSITASAQSSIECSTFGQDDYERQRCEEKAAENSRTLSRTMFETADRSLLPDTNAAWVVHIVTLGGLTGMGLPTVTVTSDGEVACGEKEPLKFVSLEAGRVDLLAELIASADFKTEGQLKASKAPLPFACSDCYRTRILIVRREADGRVRSYNNSPEVLDYPLITERFGLIRRKVFELVSCVSGS